MTVDEHQGSDGGDDSAPQLDHDDKHTTLNILTAIYLNTLKLVNFIYVNYSH